VNPGILIIGASPAGLQAALDLAAVGIEVFLTEISPFIGDEPGSEFPSDMSSAHALEAAKHPRVYLLTRTALKSAEKIRDVFKVRLQMRPRYVDLDRCTSCGDCLEVCPVQVPGIDHKAIYLGDGHQPQSAAIDKMGLAPCSHSCPAGIHVQGYVALIAQGRFQEALDLVREAIPFPGICGRICTHPCEINCRRNEIDEPVAIRQLKRFVADWELKKNDPSNRKKLRLALPAAGAKQVAIVGAGPSGLTAAHDLALKNYKVTVFEKLPVAGGMMAVGIPAYRLPRDILEAEIGAIEEMGVEIKTGITFGKDLNLKTLRSDGYSALFLATGLHGSRRLGIVGENLSGVFDGVSFLHDVALGKKVSPAEKLIVVGGGNVAIDVALTARRLGSRSVTIVCLETREEMPARDEEMKEALAAGVEIVNCFGPNRFLSKNNQFTGIEFKRCTCVFDDQCNFNPQYDENELSTLEAEAVMIAIGQCADMDFLKPGNTMRSPQGGIRADPHTLQTNIPWVFAGGDALYGPKTVIEAIASGKRAAESIDRYLNRLDSKGNRVSQRPDAVKAEDHINGHPFRGHLQQRVQLSISERPLTEVERMPKPRISMPVLSKEKSLCSFSEVELGFSEEQAIAEAQRCLACGPCSECMACVEACKAGAVNHAEREKVVDFEMGAIILADGLTTFAQFKLQAGPGLYRISPRETFAGSVAAARAMRHTRVEWYFTAPSTGMGAYLEGPARTGVFLCQCGDHIARVVDTDALRQQSTDLPGVIHADVIPQACLPEAAEHIDNAVLNHGLNRVLLAACSCCSLDQVCSSCTQQRVRCKANLGLFTAGLNGSRCKTDHLSAGNWSNLIWEFVNIREQCAWVHADDPAAATAKADRLIAAAAVKLKMASPPQAPWTEAERSVLVVGNGSAARMCQDLLDDRQIVTRVVEQLPHQIRRVDGQYAVSNPLTVQKATAVVLAPQDAVEAQLLCNAFAASGQVERIMPMPPDVETLLPGVFFCDPLNGRSSGAAAAVKVSGWLHQLTEQTKPVAASVDPHRCRACKTCIDICQLSAPQLVGEDPQRHCWIDPMICSGCASCAARCPSGAITAGYATDEQLQAMLAAVLKADDINARPKAVVFTCNWNAYRGLESAGRRHASYPSWLYPLKVMCLGRLSPGILLNAFHLNADGILLLGCAPDECHYSFGNQRVRETFDLTRRLMQLLGYSDRCLVMDRIAAGDADSGVSKIQLFVDGLNGGRQKHG
jgi:NADPH-dependent glutamate synthase beta subunit-like oxidoreductase/coenzyme F420-reducing hydrogenase delta subunit/Pyruvate/2-oxoacid:ferredoxin oxidoreductase delta subunit